MIDFYVESTDSFVIESETQVLPATMTRKVDGEKFVIHGKKRIVTETGEEVFDWRVEQLNSEMLFTKYSRKHGLMTSSEARELRSAVDVSRKVFSNMVGISEMSVKLIEGGSMISNEGNALLRQFKELYNNCDAMVSR